MPHRFSFFALVLLASPVAAQLSPEKALAAMQVAPGFQCELFASEPMFVNPTSIDVDHKGRVWVCESVNYRHKLRGRPPVRAEGDRIVVLVDKTGDGKATEAVTFYQSPDVLAPMGIAVAPYPDGKGQKVFVCQSPNIWVFEDKDGDLKADGPPKVLLTGFRGIDHDHGVHGINIGPDGKLYFTVGDQGVKDLQSSDGKGRKWTSNNTDCRAGTVWRCDQDGTNLELIAHNFRNNYECCVDSFGEIWLSDNDDDGNQQTRICYVMPGGDYGYHPRGPGQSHWHEEQPGIVHKVLRTGFGSPTGICFYEGTLLPEKYRGNLLHCDAGPREVRAFFKKPKGAGYELEKEVLLTSPDNWFRPSDVCVAPDGSVFVADWYDPGVGGHGMGDTTRGRIYRLTPTGHKGYIKTDFSTNSSIAQLLSSPCLATREIAQARLSQVEAEKAHLELFQFMARSKDDAAIARALFQVKSNAENVFSQLSKEDNELFDKKLEQFTTSPQFRAQTFRKIPDNVKNPSKAERICMHTAVEIKFDQYSTMVIREGLLALVKVEPEQCARIIIEAAKKFDGQDRFYLAALNIACGTDPKRRDEILADFDKHFPEWNDRIADLVWELRPKSTLARLDKLLVDPKLTAAQKARIVDILAASDSPDAGKTVLGLLTTDNSAEVKAKAIEQLKFFLPGKWANLGKSDALKSAMAALLADGKTTTTGLQLVAAAKYTAGVPEVAKIGKDVKATKEARLEAVRTLAQLRTPAAVEALIAIGTPENPLSVECVKALAGHLTTGPKDQYAGAEPAKFALQRAVGTGTAAMELRQAAVSALAGTRPGTDWLLKQHEEKKLPADLVAYAGRLLRNSPFQGQRNKAMILFPAAGKLDPKTLPTPGELAKKTGNAEAGKALFAKSLTNDVQCMKCHSVRGSGGQIGPDLSMIGKKASKENLFESILQPSKAIADQYVTWKVETTDGQAIAGLLVQETPEALTLRDANGKDYVISTKNVEPGGKKKLLASIMPEDLVKTLTEQDLIDLVAYLATLQTPAYTPDSWHAIGPFVRAADPAAGIANDFGPAAATFDPKATFPEWNGPSSGIKAKDLGWTIARPGADGKVVLPGAEGSKTTVGYAFKSIESPNFQEATILVSYPGLARVWVNGVMVHATAPGRKDTADPDAIAVQLKRGANAVFVKFAYENAKPGFAFTVLSGQELKGK